jgi:FAD/FMN-containing dehydrogenase
MSTPHSGGRPDAAAIAGLRASFNGEIITPSDPGYDDARSLWNAMIDKKPAVIARCSGSEDVVSALGFAREHGLEVAVKGAGHNIAGSAMCDGGVVIDLSALQAVDVDPASMTARVESGATLADVDEATQAHGLAVPTGINSTTGIAGLTLGGGFGWLSRKHGLTVDNLMAAEMVTAEGERVRASELENPDLFWAIRGGGGNFGVVTSFTFRLHPVGPEVLAGLIIHPMSDAPNVMRQLRDHNRTAPDELSVWMVLRKAPPLPFIPEDWHGKDVLVLAAMYAGDTGDGNAALDPVRSIGSPIAEAIGAQPFAAWQQAFDPLLTPGARNYWKSHDFHELTDKAIDTLVEYAGRLPTAECEVFIARMGGQTNRVPADATAYPHRDTEYVMNIHTRWRDPAEDAECLEWAREAFDAMAPHATGGVYVNFMPDDEVDRVRSAYGTNYDRLAEIKARWDPGNVFRANQNIRPAVPA